MNEKKSKNRIDKENFLKKSNKKTCKKEKKKKKKKKKERKKRKKKRKSLLAKLPQNFQKYPFFQAYIFFNTPLKCRKKGRITFTLRGAKGAFFFPTFSFFRIPNPHSPKKKQILGTKLNLSRS